VEQGRIKSAKPNVRTAFHCFGQNEPDLRANAAVTALLEEDGFVRLYQQSSLRLLFRRTHDVRPRPFTPCQRLQYGIQDAIEILADILCKKSQNEIAVLLQQSVFPAITPVGFWIGEMLRTIEFQDDTQRLVEEIDLHLTMAIERNWYPKVQLKASFRLGKSFKTPI